jgi:small-conductance mechanosensitive channel
MRDANDAMRDGEDREQLQRASEEARRQLEGARDRAAEEQRQAMQASLTELGDRADNIYETQRDLEQQLQESIRKLLVESDDSDYVGSGMTMEEEYEMADAKRKLQAELRTLNQDSKPGTATERKRAAHLAAARRCRQQITRATNRHPHCRSGSIYRTGRSNLCRGKRKCRDGGITRIARGFAPGAVDDRRRSQHV